jgi:RNA polymerase sigma-70 factor (ECF subfamily)
MIITQRNNRPPLHGRRDSIGANAFLRSEPNENADIFVKRYWYLQSVKEIAAAYDYTDNKITSLLFRMRGRLRVQFESEGLL